MYDKNNALGRISKALERVGNQDIQQILANIKPVGNFVQNGFRVELFASENLLIIEAEDTEAGSFYIRQLTPSEITRVTHGIFAIAQDFADFLLYAPTAPLEDEVKLRIDKDATIFISQKIKIGNRKNEITTELELEEEQLKPIHKCKKYFKKLKDYEAENSDPFNSQLIKLIEKVLEHNDQLETQLSKAQEDIQKLKAKVPQ